MTEEDLRILRRQARSLGEALGIPSAKNALLRCIEELERLSALERSLKAWVDHQQRLSEQADSPQTVAEMEADTRLLASEALARISAYRRSIREQGTQVRAQE